MSIDLMNQVDGATNLKGSLKHTLSNLARWADAETGLVWIKHETQARHIGRSEETVRTATKHLEELNHLSRLRTAGRVTIYLLHPCDSLAQRPQLPWSVFEAHLQKSHFGHSKWPRIAGWLASLGVLSDEDAIDESAKYFAAEARRKANGNERSFTEVQKFWAATTKILGLDPKVGHVPAQAIGSEYIGNDPKSNLDGESIIGAAANDANNTGRRLGTTESPKGNRHAEKMRTQSVIEQIRAEMTPDQLAVEQARVQQILRGVGRADRLTMIADHPAAPDPPE